MTLPAGVTTFELRFGGATDFEGSPLHTELVITPSHEIVWGATGDRIVPIKVSRDAEEGEFNSAHLPHTDQTGFVDLAGNAITNWWYTVVSTDLQGSRAAGGPKTRRIQATSDVETVDLDLIPTNGTVGPVGVTTGPVVTSVNGQTGAVTVEVDTSDLVPVAQKGAASGVAELDGDALVPVEQIPVAAIAESSELTATFVAVRTSDGQPLAPGTIVVITLDKTLAEITSSPVADIADITFEEA